MTLLYRYNRPKALQSAVVSVSDDLLSIEYRLGVPDLSFAGTGELPMIPGETARIEMTLADLKALRDFDDGAMLSFNVDAPLSGAPIEWRNLYVGTMLGRRSMVSYLAEIGWNTPIRILVPARGITSLKQCRFIVQMHDAEKPLECNVPVAGMEVSAFLGMQFVPKLTGPETVSAESPTASYSIQLRDSDGVPVAASGSIYLEATAGNLTRYRVDLDETGAGSFDLLTAGLVAGDKTKIKAGFRYFPGADDLVVSLT